MFRIPCGLFYSFSPKHNQTYQLFISEKHQKSIAFPCMYAGHNGLESWMSFGEKKSKVPLAYCTCHDFQQSFPQGRQEYCFADLFVLFTLSWEQNIWAKQSSGKLNYGRKKKNSCGAWKHKRRLCQGKEWETYSLAYLRWHWKLVFSTRSCTSVSCAY